MPRPTPFTFPIAARAVLCFAAFLVVAQAGQTASIIDPVLQMPAWTLSNIPDGWTAEGTMLPGSSCVSGTSPVVRVTSPDGQAGAYQLPRSDWAWGAGVRSQNDCLPFQGPLSAKEFLDHLARVRGLEIVREEPVPELDGMLRNAENMNRQSQGMMRFRPDLARYLVRYSVKEQAVEEWLTANVSCMDKMVMGLGQQHSCSAFVTRWFAPAGKFRALLPQFQEMRMTLNQPWMDRWQAAMVNHIQTVTQAQTAALLEQGRLAGAQRMQAHRDFTAATQRGYDAHNERARNDLARKTQNKEDYVDYILDCQRAYSGNRRISAGNCVTRETF